MNNICCNSDERRLAVLQHPSINGIDFLEVIDNPSDPDEVRQTVLAVHFFKDIAADAFVPSNIVVAGGERIKNIKVLTVTRADLAIPPVATTAANVLVIKVNKAGDFSTYQLQLIREEGMNDPPNGFDPLLAVIDFSFKIACPGEFDCVPADECITPKSNEKPAINYLAKDYASFKQLMLDRMALTIPAWKERNPADMGIMLVELLAYAADYLSYRQDAIATEAYLGTARKRISVKRHARLVDYKMHDGCSARTWVHLEVTDNIDGIVLKGNNHGNSIKFVTAVPQNPFVLKGNTTAADKLFNSNGYEVFEPVHDLELDYRLNKLFFYTWGQTKCHLNKGAVTATLDGHITGLPGKILIIQEEVNPYTFNKADAAISKRHAVRVESAEHVYDILAENPDAPGDPKGKPVTKVNWNEEDAMPFSLCLSTINNEGETIVTSSLIGNNVLAEHGNTITEELHYSKDNKQPKLKYGPLSNGLIYEDNPAVSANALMHVKAEQANPIIKLYEQNDAELEWIPVADLISSQFNSRHFVVELKQDEKARLRFGNNINGQKPVENLSFNAVYRIGNGGQGNIAAGALAHLVSTDPAISVDTIKSVTNIVAATGGTEPEKIEEVKYRAPIAFRKQERAVTTADYEEKAKAANKNIQRSAATTRWTGSWRTVFLAVDTFNEQLMNDGFISKLTNDLEKYRLAGQDIAIEQPDYVSLEIEIDICVSPGYSRSDIKAAILRQLSNRILPNGDTGLFHPDNFTFGQPVYLSKLYSVIHKQAGVTSVTIKKFQRQGINSTSALQSGKLNMGKTEIARLDNNPNAFENGILTLNMTGGN